MPSFAIYFMLLNTACLWICFGQTESSGSRDKVNSLVRELLTRYENMTETYIPPWNDNFDPVKVNINWYPTNIFNFDERDQLIEFGGVLTMNWYDPILLWDAQTSGINSVELPLRKIWSPTLLLEESWTEKYKSIFYENYLASVSHDGHVLWESPVKTSTFCRVMETRFPFDQQACKLTFSSVVSYKKETEFSYLNITVPDTTIANGPWEIEAVTVPNCTGIVKFTNRTAIRFVVGLKSQRRQRYYMVTLVIPCVLLSGFTPFIFLIPGKTDLKVPIMTLHTVTIFLYQGLVDSFGPPTGSSLLSMFVALTMIEAASVTVLSIISTRLYHRKSLLPKFRPKGTLHKGKNTPSQNGTGSQLSQMTSTGSLHSQETTLAKEDIRRCGEETNLLDKDCEVAGRYGCCQGMQKSLIAQLVLLSFFSNVSGSLYS